MILNYKDLIKIYLQEQVYQKKLFFNIYFFQFKYYNIILHMGCGNSQIAETLGIKKITNDYFKPQITILYILKDSDESTLYNVTMMDGQDYIIKKFEYTDNSQLIGAIKLQGKQFVEIVNIFQDLKNIYVVTRKLIAKSLLEYCQELVQFSEFQIIEFIKQLQQIFQSIISSGIKHLNFNLNKILINGEGKLVITDYYYPSSKYWNFDFFFPPDWNHEISHIHQINEHFYVYQIGIITYLLLTGEIPDQKKLSQNSIKNLQISTQAKEFLNQTLNQDPFVRIQLKLFDQCKWFIQYSNQHRQNKLKETNIISDQSIINWKFDTYYYFKIFYLLLDYFKSVKQLRKQFNQIREEIFDLNLVEAMERGVLKTSNYISIINKIFNHDQIKVQRFSLNLKEIFDSEQYLDLIEMILMKQYQKSLIFFEKNELIDMDKMIILKDNFNSFREIYRPMFGNPEIFLSKTSKFLSKVNAQTKFQQFVDVINIDL
ncbi:hypothetical protein pb186bvf_013960 [Paramecium bursaria]